MRTPFLANWSMFATDVYAIAFLSSVRLPGLDLDELFPRLANILPLLLTAAARPLRIRGAASARSSPKSLNWKLRLRSYRCVVHGIGIASRILAERGRV